MPAMSSLALAAAAGAGLGTSKILGDKKNKKNKAAASLAASQAAEKQEESSVKYGSLKNKYATLLNANKEEERSETLI